MEEQLKNETDKLNISFDEIKKKACHWDNGYELDELRVCYEDIATRGRNGVISYASIGYHLILRIRFEIDEDVEETKEEFRYVLEKVKEIMSRIRCKNV